VPSIRASSLLGHPHGRLSSYASGDDGGHRQRRPDHRRRHGMDDYGFMGSPDQDTRLDRLASQSLAFRRDMRRAASVRQPRQHPDGRYPTSTRSPQRSSAAPGVDERSAQRNPAFLERRKEMIKYFDEMQTLPRLLAPRNTSASGGQVVGGSYKRALHARHDARRSERGGRHGDAGLAIAVRA